MTVAKPGRGAGRPRFRRPDLVTEATEHKQEFTEQMD
jgi:hypothetical protein